MRRRLKPTDHEPHIVVAGVALTASVVALIALSVPAAAAAGWSRTPAAGTAGAAIRVASSPTTLCQWSQPAADAASGSAAEPAGTAGTGPNADAVGAPQTFDGTSVEIRLERAGSVTDLATLEVTPGGAWAGSFTVPEPTVVAAGEYDLIARCVIDRTDLDGRRTFDFDPLTFSVVDAPPPTTITIPTELVPPITVINPSPLEVEGEQLDRRAEPAAASASAAADVPTLPKTGDGTLAVAVSGIGALLLGVGALWWGSRYARPAGHT
ncbi:MAG: LPXTG cell wall anchor domain-containing protein [Acidimicrobiia bacterium]|nr:LPXTG cell wall anchor domain-containing protein [Acidimicrobiia bacterium]